MKIAVFEVEEWEREAFEGLADEHEVVYSEEPLTADSAAEFQDAQVVSPFVYSELGAETLEQLSDLEFIATRSTGFDHIDIDYCREHGIPVSNVPTYGENTVAEHVFALLLAISHRLIEAADRTRRGDFSQKGLRGFDLKGKTLGVVGTGNIGQHVIRIAKGFGMEVLAQDVKPDGEVAERLGFRYVELERLLQESDVVTLHVPGGKSTRHLIGAEEFEQFKPGAVLINTSRGEVTDVHALLRALSSGRLAAAGLDVLPEEPVIREEAELLHSVIHREHDLETLLVDHVLLRLRNVVITPHSAFNTREAVERILETTRQNIESFVAGDLRNSVISGGDGA